MKSTRIAALSLFYFAQLLSCKQKTPLSSYVPPLSPLFVKMDSVYTGIGFTNYVEDGADYNIITYRNFYNGGGVAFGDINNDGWQDVFLTANQGESKLYLNNGGFKFTDITAGSGIKSKRGWRTGVTMADVNNDGWLDIYICNSGDISGDNKENELYINQHNNSFTEKAKELGLNDPGYTTHISFFDYDLDGDLDCYILNNSFVDVRKFDLEAVRKQRDTLGGHKLMRNDNGRFTDISEKAGISGTKIAYGLGVSVGDVNGDMYPDIYISNDFYEKDYLYINQKNGTFKDELPARMGHITSSSMGADLADLNNDGALDIVTTDMLPEDEYRVKTLTRFEQYHVENMKYRSSFHYQFPQNTLQMNQGDGRFAELAFMAGIAATDWSWGALSFDFDNDGYKDIFISNGVYKDISDMDFADFLANKQNIADIVAQTGKFDFKDFLSKIPSTKLPNYAFINQRNLGFENKSYELGLGEPSFSNGVAYADLDNDGDMDLVVNNINAPCFVYRNESEKKTGNHSLQIGFRGNILNPFGTGTWVNLYVAGQKQSLQNIPVRSFQSCVDNRLIFGLGKNTRADSLEVIWPDLKKQVLYNIDGGRMLILEQKNANLQFKKNENGEVLFAEKTNQLLRTVARHRENLYTDFDAERLMPYMLSTQGPGLAVADVNKDGLNDIFIGGAVNDTAKLLLQTLNGFIASVQPAFAADSELEDADAVFLDIDKDGDQDILVASGGYQYDQGSSLLASRLYVNDGTGKFSKGSMPEISTNASCVRTADFDNDGYIDVFIGGRAITGKFGSPGRSYLLHNDKGVLKDITPDDLKNTGMVTDAIWSDINADKMPDLVVVGEWMPVCYFLNKGGRISGKKSVPASGGLWNCITAADLDKDGDTDFVLGNWGLNSRFRASVDKPMEIYTGDFDKNETTESLITYYWSDGKSHLYHSKEDLTSQLPHLKKKILMYKDYAGKSINDIFDSDILKQASVSTVQTLASSILVNSGKDEFILQALPPMAQSSPIFCLLTGDYNGDGHIDILTGGNFFEVKPDIGRLDANASCILIGDGKMGFHFISPAQSGLHLAGQVRSMAEIIVNGNRHVILARNNEPVTFYGINK
jgi:hypothetical protein